MSKPLSVKNLYKSYGTVEAVKGVSFELNEGEIFGLLGPNGAGKTSIIAVITTLEGPTSGEVQVFGHDVTKDARKAKSMLGFVPQETINYGYFNVEEILEFISGYYGIMNNSSRIEDLLKRLQLWTHRHKKVRQLSGGMKRRLLIAKSLVHSPKLVLLDEPTAGVDVELRSILWDFVRDLKKQGVTMLLTTHYLEEAEDLCDRIGILHHGVLRNIGPTQELIKQFTQRDVKLILRNKINNFKHPNLIKYENNELHFRVPMGQSVGSLLLESQIDLKELLDVKIEEGHLEDAFKTVLGSTTP